MWKLGLCRVLSRDDEAAEKCEAAVGAEKVKELRDSQASKEGLEARAERVLVG